jgi:P-type Cu2+ transporter
MKSETIVLDIGGMKCAGCVRAVERHLLADERVEVARVNLLTGMAAVKPKAEGNISGAELAATLTGKGFPSTARTAETAQRIDLRSKYNRESRYLWERLIVAGSLLILSTIGHFSQPMTQMTHQHHAPNLLSTFWWHGLLATIALVWPGRSILVDGCLSLVRGMPNMNTLVGLGATCSYLASVIALIFPSLGWECFFEEPVMIIGFILLGRTLEGQAKHRAAGAFIDLLSLQPTTARIISTPDLGSAGMEVPIEMVRAGEYLSILPGEKMPADGTIRSGTTSVDEAMLTGEAAPVIKQTGDLVIAGSINRTGAIAIEVQKTGAETVLAQILELVETAQTRKSPLQSLADRVAGYFTYGVLTIAGLTLLFWYTLGRYSPFTDIHWQSLLPIKTTIATIAIACPCALGLATPTAILVGTGVGAKRGLLFKGGDVLENIGKLTTIAFDKTGTLTIGKPQVTEIRAVDGNSDRLLAYAAAAEATTNHPLAEAILQAAIDRQLAMPTVTAATTTLGMGAMAELSTGEKIIIGSDRFLTQQGVEIGEIIPTGQSTSHIAINGSYAGSIVSNDTLRRDAAQTVRELKMMGLDIVLLSGDKPEIVDRTAAELGIDRVYSRMLPSDKARIISELQANGGMVGTIGDGINDAPALAQADVGISIKGSTDIALEVADLILMGDRLMDLPRSIALARATRRKIQQNLFWAAIYNCIGIPAAAGIFYWCGIGPLLSPATAGALMAMSSVSVVVNSLIGLSLSGDQHSHQTTGNLVMDGIGKASSAG